MKKIIVILATLFLGITIFASAEFIQEDLKVAINKYSGSNVYFTGTDDLYVEAGTGSDFVTIRVPKGKVLNISKKGNYVCINGKNYGKIRVLKGSFDADIKLSKDKKKYSTYRGDMDFIIYKDKVMPISQIQSEEYLYSVVPSEIGHYFPEEAIKAQVLAARTYLYFNLAHYKYKNFDLLDNVNSQMFLGKDREHPKINGLVDATRSEIITHDGKPINALYYSTSGGYTANSEDVWSGSSKPYLKGKKDKADETKSPRLNWEVSITKKDLSKKIGFTVKSLKVLKVSSNRVEKIQLIGSKKKTISGNELRRIVGYNKIHSTQFKVSNRKNDFYFKGKGSGHGVGMSQYGAYGLAKSGKNYSQILKHYYNGIKIKKLKNG